jgi:hypothetical protein
MKENESPPINPGTREVTRPPFERMVKGLNEFVAELGLPVREAFLPGKQLSGRDHETGALVFHPWAPVRLRAEVLLSEAVECLVMREIDPEEEYGNWTSLAEAIGWRPSEVHRTVARSYGLEAPEGDEVNDPLNVREQQLVNRIVGAIEEDQLPSEY